MVSYSYILINLKNKNKEDSEKIVKSQARLYASNIASLINVDLGVARGMASAMYDYENLSASEKRKQYDNMMRSTLDMNESYVCTWYSWQLSKFSQTWGNKPGRIIGAYIRDGKETLETFDSLDISGIENRNNYHWIMDNKHETLFEPYYDRTIGLYETTVAVPIVKNDEFVGLVGIDLDLKYFQDLIKEIKPYKTGYAFLISNKGKYVYHPDSSIIGSTFAEINTEDDSIHGISKTLEQGNEFELYATHSETNGDIFVFFTPVKIGNTSTPWSLGVLVYMDQVMAEANIITRNTLFAGIIGLIVLLSIMFFATNYSFRSINKGIEFAKIISQGDLTAKLDIHSKDEIGELGEALRLMVDRFKEMISDMKDSALQMDAFSESFKNKSTNYEKIAEQQKQSAVSISDSLNDISANIKLSHSNTESTRSISQNAMHELEEGKSMILQTVNSMNEIADHITIIGDLAERTDLLAINASIEAARAGEQGKGFSVVAQEVRKLSERSSLAAKQINDLTQKGVSISSDTGNRITELLPEIEKTVELVQEIAVLSSEQNNNIDTILKAMEDLNIISNENQNVAFEMSESTTKFEKLSENLNVIINKFKI